KSFDKTIRFVAGDAGALPFCDHSIDTIISLEAIEHVPDAEKVLMEMARVLRAEGLLIISTPNKWVTSPLRMRPINPYHVREWYPGRFKEIVSRHFEIEEVLGQSWHSVGLVFRVFCQNLKNPLKAALVSLKLIDLARRMFRKQRCAQERVEDASLPS